MMFVKKGSGGVPMESDSPGEGRDVALRIGDAASKFGLSTRTLRYWEELGLVSPSEYTSGGERRYLASDLAQLGRILELKELLGLNLEEIKSVLNAQSRLEELRREYRANKTRADRSKDAEQREILEEAMALSETLAAKLDEKLSRISKFKEKLSQDVVRCQELLDRIG